MKKKIMAMMLIPISVLGIIIYAVLGTVVKNTMQEDIEKKLKSVVVAFSETYEQYEGDYIMDDDGIVWKGEYNISESEHMLQNIQSHSDIDVTFCFGKTRKVTSLVDKNTGEPIIGTDVSDEVAKAVLGKGEDVFVKDIVINDMDFYGYYMPVHQSGTDEVIGMFFAGAPMDQEDKAFDAVMKTVTIVVVLIAILCIIVAPILATSMSSAIEAGSRAVKEVAAGNLNTEVAPKYLRRKDVIGDLCRAVNSMKEELRLIIGDINSHAQTLLSSAGTLDNNAQATLTTVDSVDKAVNDIAEGATSQAKDAIKATENVSVMGDMLEATNGEISKLTDNTRIMKESSEQATKSLEELKKINEEVMFAIEQIFEQTNRTNTSSQKIKGATDMISSIAEETNLLSLNASIEAARAGEQGRGFAVVANEIQHLAEQTGETTESIANMVGELISDSDTAVETMYMVKNIVEQQSRNVEETQVIVQAVISAIETSVVAISSIEEQSAQLNEAKNQIIEVVENLSAISEENAASTEETSAATAEVANSFNEVTMEAESLKHIADGIAETVAVFKL
ncbi:MAG: methyl-accepting chemotaxis protein [Lachnospiraceae bacterium]|nr:methyl-accepting chemotaxis protein [Lachnospiraceae bacterium]